MCWSLKRSLLAESSRSRQVESPPRMIAVVYHLRLGVPSVVQVVFSSKSTLPSLAGLYVGSKQQGPFEPACSEPLPLPPRTKHQLILSADSIGKHRFLKIQFMGGQEQGQGEESEWNSNAFSVHGLPSHFSKLCNLTSPPLFIPKACIRLTSSP